MKRLIYICIPTIAGREAVTKRCIDSIESFTNIPYCLVIYKNNSGGWVKAVHEMLSGIDGFVVLLGCDVTVTENWLQALSDAFFQAFPGMDGLAQPWDDHNKGRLAQHPLGHSDTFKRYLYKGYVHNYSDNELTFHMEQLGKYIVVRDSVIIHNHWRNGRAEFDHGYQAIIENHAHDKALFLKRRLQGFPNDLKQ